MPSVCDGDPKLPRGAYNCLPKKTRPSDRRPQFAKLSDVFSGGPSAPCSEGPVCPDWTLRAGGVLH